MKNKRQHKFDSHWEPKLLSQKILAEGIWYYDDKIPYNIQLVVDQYDYKFEDLEEIQKFANEIVIEDYVNENINSEGEIYYWLIIKSNGRTTSPTFGNISEAIEHAKTYGKMELKWNIANHEKRGG